MMKSAERIRNDTHLIASYLFSFGGQMNSLSGQRILSMREFKHQDLSEEQKVGIEDRISSLPKSFLSMHEVKHQNLPEVQKVDVEDRISSLPKDVLQHILSFLETKDAVLTGILSRRWRYLWTGVPIVDFDDKPLYSNQSKFWYSIDAGCFMNFVERVLLFRDASDIKRFRLSCRVFFNASRVHSWISAAVKHKVQELDLCLFVEETFLLPHSVFNSASLTFLKLEMNCNLQLPSQISFPGLKILHLGLLTFQNDNSVERLFSCCPMLEELDILDCDWMELKSVTICIPSLKKLTIEDLPLFGLFGDTNGCKIKINAAKLSSLRYCGYLNNDIQLSDLLRSVKVSLHIPIAWETLDQIAPRASNLFQKVENASSLKISTCTIESLFQANLLDHLPIFPQLNHLELTMKAKEHNVGFLIKFLEHFPKLRSLHFTKVSDPLLSLNGDGWTWESVPSCLFSSLKRVDFHNFSGNDSELFLLETLLKSAPCLERINLFFFKSLSTKLNDWVDLRNQLERYPRRSKCCVITIY